MTPKEKAEEISIPELIVYEVRLAEYIEPIKVSATNIESKDGSLMMYRYGTLVFAAPSHNSIIYKSLEQPKKL
jgi:hypothetical protein